MNKEKLGKLFDEAIKLLEKEEWVASIAKWDEIIPWLDGDDKATAYSNRGNAKDGIGDYQGAIDDYNQALEINPQHAEVYYNLGNTKGHMGDYKGALADLGRAIEINPRFANAYNNRGKIKNDIGFPKNAIDDYDQALGINPQHAEAYNNRGNAKNSIGDYKGAIADINRALGINPQYANAYNNRGNAKGHMGDHKGAIADYDRAIMINSNHTSAIRNRAVALALQLQQEKFDHELQAQLRKQQEQQEQFDRERQEQLRKQQEQFDRERQEQLRKQQEQFDRERQEQLQEQQEKFDRERQEQLREQQEQFDREKQEREAGVRIIDSNEYIYTLEEYERRAARRGKWVWFLSGALALAAIAVYGHIARLGIEAWQAAQSPMAMIHFSALSLFPFILMGTLVLSPLVWVIRMLNRDKHKYWVLREDAVANINLLRIIETGHNKREDLWLQLFDHYDKRGSANLIADWNRTDTGGNNFTIKPGGGDN